MTTGATMFARTVGSAIGVAVFGALVNAVGHRRRRPRQPRPRAPLPGRPRAGDPHGVRGLRDRRRRPGRRQPADAAPDRARTRTGEQPSLAFLAGASVARRRCGHGDPGRDRRGRAGARSARDEPHQQGGLNNRLNWLRAAVLGANDGIVSTAGIVMGVAGATSDRTAILIAGVAGLAAGALSMARRGVRLGQHPARLRAGAAGQGAPRAARRAGRGARGAGRALRREGPHRGAGARGRRAADRARRARRARRGRARHRPRRHHEPVERGLRLDARLHDRRAAAAAHDHARRPGRCGSGSRSSSVRWRWRSPGWASARLGYGAPGRAVLRNVAGGLFAMAVTYAIGSAVGTQI